MAHRDPLPISRAHASIHAHLFPTSPRTIDVSGTVTARQAAEMLARLGQEAHDFPDYSIPGRDVWVEVCHALGAEMAMRSALASPPGHIAATRSLAPDAANEPKAPLPAVVSAGRRRIAL